MKSATFRIWRGDAHAGEFRDYTSDVSEGMVVLDAIHRIQSTQANDLANHVRHVHEYHLALRERQFPPLVAPSLNGGTRIPLFQYYSGTAYLVPGVIAWAGHSKVRSVG